MKGVRGQGRTRVSTYVLLSTLTPEGSKTLHNRPERIDEVNREIEDFGCKIVFDGEGHVFFSVGERGTNMGVQESVMNPYGKIMRLNLDGTRGSCTACHSRHDFSARRARRPTMRRS